MLHILGSCVLLFAQIAAYGHGHRGIPHLLARARPRVGEGRTRAQSLPPSGGVGDIEQITARSCLQEKDTGIFQSEVLALESFPT